MDGPRVVRPTREEQLLYFGVQGGAGPEKKIKKTESVRKGHSGTKEYCLWR